MGSVGNPNSNPWSPYDNYKDCSLQICSIYCPQFCYFIFPPPPPSDDDDDSATPFSPLIISIIGVLAGAFLLVSYYTIVTRYCRRRRAIRRNQDPSDDENLDEGIAVHHQDHQWQGAASAGLDEALIKAIAICKYIKGEGLIEGTECAVCLSEFQENESLRLLPKCSHAFHLPCIDTWLKSQSNCPLCRASVVPGPGQGQGPDPPGLNAADYEARRPDDELIVVVDDQAVVSVVCDDRDDDHGQDGHIAEEHCINDQAGAKSFRRSVSLGAFSCEKDESWRGFAMRRSISTGRMGKF